MNRIARDLNVILARIRRRAMTSGDADVESSRLAIARDVFCALRSRQCAFEDVLRDRFADWRALFATLKELKARDGSALRDVAKATSSCEFEHWGRERSAMFVDEFAKMMANAAVVEAIGDDLGCAPTERERTGRGAREGNASSGEPSGSAFGMITVQRELELSDARERGRETPTMGSRGRARNSPTPTPTPTPASRERARNSPPPTPRPSHLSPPPNEYGKYAIKVDASPTADDDAHTEHLMSYLTGFHGLLFGLKDHVERIRTATIENVAEELARTDARLDTAIARLEAAMSVESGEGA